MRDRLTVYKKKTSSSETSGAGMAVVSRGELLLLMAVGMGSLIGL